MLCTEKINYFLYVYIHIIRTYNKLHYAFCLRQDIFAFIVKTSNTEQTLRGKNTEANI